MRGSTTLLYLNHTRVTRTTNTHESSEVDNNEVERQVAYSLVVWFRVQGCSTDRPRLWEATNLILLNKTYLGSRRRSGYPFHRRQAGTFCSGETDTAFISSITGRPWFGTPYLLSKCNDFREDVALALVLLFFVQVC
jgi:hypothetical protein